MDSFTKPIGEIVAIKCSSSTIISRNLLGSVDTLLHKRPQIDRVNIVIFTKISQDIVHFDKAIFVFVEVQKSFPNTYPQLGKLFLYLSVQIGKTFCHISFYRGQLILRLQELLFPLSAWRTLYILYILNQHKLGIEMFFEVQQFDHWFWLIWLRMREDVVAVEP